METVYTSAPEAYDGFSTTTVLACAGTDKRGQTIRQVEMEQADYGWQTGRYMSGLYCAYSQTQADEMFDSGLWVRAETDQSEERTA